MPRIVLKSPRISLQAKSIFCTILDYAWYGTAFPSRDTLAAENGVHPNTVDKALKELAEMTLMTVIRRGNKQTNLYIIEDFTSPEMIEKLAPVMEIDDIPQTQPATPPEPPRPRGQDIPFGEIIDYLNEKAGTAYKANSKATQTKIRARWNEGYRVDDFKKVIDRKCADWLGNADMSPYLRPDTLFGTKFESYLNAPTNRPPTPPNAPSGLRRESEEFLNRYGR